MHNVSYGRGTSWALAKTWIFSAQPGAALAGAFFSVAEPDEHP
jgi:hypothetical protein